MPADGLEVPAAPAAAASTAASAAPAPAAAAPARAAVDMQHALRAVAAKTAAQLPPEGLAILIHELGLEQGRQQSQPSSCELQQRLMQTRLQPPAPDAHHLSRVTRRSSSDGAAEQAQPARKKRRLAAGGALRCGADVDAAAEGQAAREWACVEAGRGFKIFTNGLQSFAVTYSSRHIKSDCTYATLDAARRAACERTDARAAAALAEKRAAWGGAVAARAASLKPAALLERGIATAPAGSPGPRAPLFCFRQRRSGSRAQARARAPVPAPAPEPVRAPLSGAVLALGDVLDPGLAGARVRLGGALGSGACGSVYAGTARDRGRGGGVPVAVKVFATTGCDHANYGKARAHWTALEFQALRLLRGTAGAVQLLASGIVDCDVASDYEELRVAVLERMRPSRSLFGDRTPTCRTFGRWPEAAARSAVRQLLHVLDAMHSGRLGKVIVHCDFKPANVLASVRPDGSVRVALADWGACILRDLEPGEAAGADGAPGGAGHARVRVRVWQPHTPSFAAPELLAALDGMAAQMDARKAAARRDRMQTDGAAAEGAEEEHADDEPQPEPEPVALDCSLDVWALGLTLLSLLTGRDPYRLAGCRGASSSTSVDCAPIVDMVRAVVDADGGGPWAKLARSAVVSAGARHFLSCATGLGAERKALPPGRRRMSAAALLRLAWLAEPPGRPQGPREGRERRRREQGASVAAAQAAAPMAAKPGRRGWAAGAAAVAARLDWSCAALIVVLGIATKAVGHRAPAARPVFASDPSIALPFTKHDMPFWVALLVPFVVLVVAAAALEFGARRRQQGVARAAVVLVNLLLTTLAALVVVGFMTELLKRLGGRLRPDFLARCQPDLAAVDAGGAVAYGTFPDVTCGAPASKALRDGHMSFPSGHSSCSATIGLVAAMYVAWSALLRDGGALHAGLVAPGQGLARRAASEAAGLGLLLVLLFEIAWPWGVALSRFRDNRHNVSDVVAGILLAVTFAPLFVLRLVRNVDAWCAGPGDAADGSARVVEVTPVAHPLGDAQLAAMVRSSGRSCCGRRRRRRRQRQRRAAPGRRRARGGAMFSLCFGFVEHICRKDEFHVLILGLDRAGKTNVLEKLKALLTDLPGMEPGQIMPTVGLNVGKMEAHGAALVFWDLGGAAGLRGIWEKYYAEAHALLFVVDAADAPRFEEAKAALDKALGTRELAGAPLLLLANKQDAPGAAGLAEVAEAFGLGRLDGSGPAVQPCSAFTGAGLADGLRWLVDAVKRSPRRYAVPRRRRTTDVAIVGGGHNGLVAAVLLARQGLKVEVFEDKPLVGGACRTEHPFPKVPGLGHSTGAYLLGVMPPELLGVLGLKLPLVRRDPHYFLPTTGSRYLLLGSDEAAMRQQFVDFFSEADWRAHTALQAEMAALREDVAPTWLGEPLSLEETAERHVRPALRQAFVDLVRQPVSAYLDRFGFKSDLLRAMYAVTDGFSGLNGTWDTPGTGMNFLVHNMCRLPGSGGTWMVVQGGMGVVTQRLAAAAMAAGAAIHTGARVDSIEVQDGRATGVVLAGGSRVDARCVVVNADPFRLRDLAGRERFEPGFNTWLDSLRKDGTTMKVNLALKGLPRFRCLPEARGQHRTTTHLLPDEGAVMASLTQSFADVQAGRLPDFPTIEWYFHTTNDPSVQDAAGHHSSALFVQWVPYELAGSSWEAEEERYVDHLLDIVDTFAPGTSDLVVDRVTLTPPKIESYFGITRGHIHHIDNSFGFDQRFPYRTPIQQLRELGITLWDPPLPPVRRPRQTADGLALDFPSEAARKDFRRACTSRVAANCCDGARAACSLKAVDRCRGPSWLRRLGWRKGAPWPEVEACEEQQMEACLAASASACQDHAESFCELVVAPQQQQQAQRQQQQQQRGGGMQR
ncbi:Pyroxd2 [Scenedesmus sp. PABB004]|nr:Pyroxd2 [Scenedesmus sp. PABB004]